MTYRSIIFSAPMVRANRAGLKSQTRRIMKPQPIEDASWAGGWMYQARTAQVAIYALRQRCPTGIAPMQPGEIRYVKEAWRARKVWDDLAPRSLAPGTAIWYEADGPAPANSGKLRPAMFMCRWMARDWVRITDVRAERVQDITEEDARAEGVITEEWDDLVENARTVSLPEGSRIENEIDVFRREWDFHAWERNDYVWRVGYERCEKPEDA